MEFYSALRERMDRQHGPLGERLRNALAAVIEGGAIVPGESLPSEREMAERLDVSRSTLRQGLKELAQMGLLTTRPGAGTVVSGRIPKALSRLSGFTEDMRLRGLLASSRVLECSISPISPDDAFRTGLPLGTPMMTLIRLRMAGGESLSYERAMVPVEAVGPGYDGSGSLYERMDERNARPRRILQSLQAIEAPADIAAHLGVREGAAVLEITQLGYGDNGSVVEDATSWYRGDRYKYVGEIRAEMVALRSRYRDQVVDILDALIASQGAALDAARDAVATALAADHLLYVVGSGHSHLLAEEVFYRAGGIAAAQAILDPDLMLHMGAERSTLLEREEGRAERVLSDYAIGRGDVVIIASNSGRNAYPIEMALACKARGATTIALTSLKHATRTTSRHQSGKLLYQLTDIVLDNGGEYGDASLPIGGRTVRMGPTSTVAGVFILNTILAEAVAKLAEAGVDVDVYQSANMQGAESEAEAIIARWRPRIRGL